MDFGARSDTGRVRENNEDSFRLAPELNLFVLSDGMGGQASGEVASRVATESIVAHFGSRYLAGFYAVDGSILYVNRGIGSSSVPIRAGAPSEVAILTLRCA